MSPKDTMRFISLLSMMADYYGTGKLADLGYDDIRRARNIINA